jgi:hypothetical protein
MDRILITAISALLLLSACEAQKPSASATVPAKAQSLSEPALIGKVIDEVTKRPIQGALIYGHYATTSGTLAGGTKFGALIKSFEVVTDANGDFKLEAWSVTDAGGPNTAATIGNKFPVIAVWKPGYALEVQQLSGIAQFRSRSNVSGGGEVKISKDLVDWSAFPYELKPVSSELDRYDALNDASYPMMMAGECGWESYSRVLLAQHNELKNMIKQYVPNSHIDADGYIQSGRPRTNPHVEYLRRTSVDRLLKAYRDSGSDGVCANPNEVFKERIK